MHNIYQSICMDELFQPTVYPGTQAYLSTFGNWRNMIKLRPRIRCDGVYICKFLYMRFGLSEASEYRPCHEVTFYKYMRFFPQGKLISAYTCQPPKKFLPKFASKVIDVMAIMNENQDKWGPNSEGEPLPFKDICIQSGSYKLWNDQIVITDPVHGCDRFEHRRFEGRVFRRYRSQFDQEQEEYNLKGGKAPLPASDFIEITFQGQKMTPEWYRWVNKLNQHDQLEPVVSDPTSKNPFVVNRNWYQVEKIENHLPNHFVFLKAADKDMI